MPRNPSSSGTPRFFASPAEFRAWLEQHHSTATELLVGFYKRDSGRPSLSWPESVEEALCFGWIDGVRRSLGAQAYTIRFTPRRPNSIWSRINVDNVERLRMLGKMHDSGLRAFLERTEARTGVYSFERAAAAVLTPEEDARLRAKPRAAAFFDAQAPWYRRTALHWVTSPKRAETRARRLDILIACSAANKRIPPLEQPRASAKAGRRAKAEQRPKRKTGSVQKGTLRRVAATARSRQPRR